MDIKNYQLSYYKNATEDFHIQCVTNARLARHPHSHSYFQIYYVISGKLTHHINDSSASMVKGDMFIVPPELVHYISAENGTSFYSFSFDPKFLLDSLGTPHFVANFLRNILENKDLQIRTAVSLPAEEILYTESLMAHIKKEFDEKAPGYYDSIRTLAILITNYIARNYYDTHTVKEYVKSNKEIIRHCIEYVESNYSEEISVGEIAKRFAMSTSNFCELFKSETGQTFHSYLNRRRIEKACEYISKGYKLTSLYPHVGYNDFSTFYRNFKKIMGISPNQYKQSE